MDSNLTKAIMQRALCNRRTITLSLAVQERAFTDQRALFATGADVPQPEPCSHPATQEQRTFSGSIESTCTTCGAVVAARAATR